MIRATAGSLGLYFVWLGVFPNEARPQPPASNSGYLEPGACAGCHREIAESYARTGMARSFGRVRAGINVPELREGAFHHGPSEEIFTVSIRAGAPFLRRHQIGFDGAVTNVLDARIAYWFGSGNHARSYISRTKSGELIELPVTWYTENGGYWAMSPGYDRPDHAGFSRNITYRCMSCHNGYPQAEAGTGAWEGGTRFAAALPEGIDCQRCHGPGRDHVDAVERRLPPEQVRHTIVNPARLSPSRELEVCLQCHLETTSLRLPATLLRHGRGPHSYRPGEPLENYALHFDRAPGNDSGDRFEFASSGYRLLQSRCYLASNGALTCTTCHNPHEPYNSPAAVGRYAEACENCHRANLEKRIAANKHSSSKDCVACHMPKRRPSDAIHARVSDHAIRKSYEAGSWNASVERHDGNTPPYRGEVTLFYPATLAKTAENEIYLALAQVKHEANLEKGLPRLEAAVAQDTSVGSEFYFELGEAYRNAGRIEKAIAYYEQACSRKPAEWRYFYRLGTALAAAGDLGRAGTALERARSLAPQEPAVLEGAANLFARQGRVREAIAVLRSALAIEPDAAGLQTNLGAKLYQLGDTTGAESAWREAVRLRPEAATMQLNLANLLASRGDFPEAQYHFKAAIRSDHSFAEAYAAYGSALAAREDWNAAREQYEAALRLNSELAVTHNDLGNVLLRTGDRKGAIREYEKALALSPQSATAHYNFGVALVAEGNIAAAEQHFREAISYAPNHFEAHLRLGQVLSARGEALLAAPHLRRAAESPDARIRSAANESLRLK